MKVVLKIIFISGLLSSFFFSSYAQINVSGTIYDSTGLNPLPSVTIMSQRGVETVSDQKGNYEVIVSANDTLWFSYLGQKTKGFPVNQIWNVYQFDISLSMTIPVLKEIKVHRNNYRLDSIENRQTYSKVFNYKRPTLGSIISSFGLGVTIDINELIRAFQIEKIRKNLKFQARLLQDEKEKFVVYRFNKRLVSQLTNLRDSELERFMKLNQPDFEFTLRTSDYEFREYILKKFREFEKE